MRGSEEMWRWKKMNELLSFLFSFSEYPLISSDPQLPLL
jgi:hypothetical protein